MLTAAVLLALACLVWPGRRPRAGPSTARGTGTLGERAHRTADPPRGTVAARWGVVRARLSGGSGAARPDWVADFADVVAVGLDAGLDLGSAVLASARSPGVVEPAPWLRARLVASVGAGRGVSECLEPPHGVPASTRRDLALLAAAWRLSEDLGARASDVTAAAADAVRSRRAAEERAVVLAAGPRASMWLLTALPLVGPVAGALVGFGPDRLYASSAARVAGLVGVLLTAAGWWGSQRLLARARRPGRTSGGAA